MNEAHQTESSVTWDCRCWLFVLSLIWMPALHAATPDAREIADGLGLSAEDRKSVLAGEIVSRTASSSNERELAVSLVFLVDLTVQELRKHVDPGRMMAVDPDTLAWAPITGDGNLEDFARLSLDPSPDKRARAYLKARPGGKLNLNTREIEAFSGVEPADGETPAQAVTRAVRNQLLHRYQDYRAKGLAGISPYARSNGKATSASDDLRKATESLVLLPAHLPELYNVLLNYPDDRPEGLEESFVWSNYVANKEPVFVLTHNMILDDGDAFALAQRQFYVSGGYNANQAITAFVPVNEGTVVFYQTRSSTDQVQGLGSAAKRSIGSRIMASTLEDLYTKLRARVEAAASAE